MRFALIASTVLLAASAVHAQTYGLYTPGAAYSGPFLGEQTPAAVAAPYSPSYLPDTLPSGATYAGVHGLKLMFNPAGAHPYSGPLFELTGHDGTVAEVCPGTTTQATGAPLICPSATLAKSDQPDWPTWDAWAVTHGGTGGSCGTGATCSVNLTLYSKIYDQAATSTTGVPWLQTTASHQFRYTLPPANGGVTWPTGNGVRSAQAVHDSQAPNAALQGYYYSGLSGSTQSFGQWFVGWPASPNYQNFLSEEYTSAAANALSLGAIDTTPAQAFGSLTPTLRFGGATYSTTPPIDNPSVLGMSAGASHRILYTPDNQGIYTAGTAATSASFTTASLGAQCTTGGGTSSCAPLNAASAGWMAWTDYYGDVFTTGAFSSADDTSVRTALNAGFGLISSGYTQEYISAGTSFSSGLGSSQNQVPPRLVAKALGPTWKSYNLGYVGQTLTALNTNKAFYFYNASPHLGVYNSSYNSGPSGAGWVVNVDTPTNDIATASYSSVANADGTDGSGCAAGGANAFSACALYYNQLVPLVTFLQGLGANVRIVIPTTVARNGFNTTSNFYESARLYYNNLLTSNAGGITGFGTKVQVSDRACNGNCSSGPIQSVFNISASISTTYFSVDAVHPNDCGYQGSCGALATAGSGSTPLGIVQLDLAAILAAYAH